MPRSFLSRNLRAAVAGQHGRLSAIRNTSAARISNWYRSRKYRQIGRMLRGTTTSYTRRNYARGRGY